MILRLSLLALVSLLLLSSTVNAAGTGSPVSVREKWALIIGIGQFQDSTLKPLAYSTKSARELSNVFEDVRFGHFTPGHIHLLLNGSATRYGIERSATENWLFRKALPNDLIVVYIATRIIEAGSGHTFYLCTADSIASDIETTGIPLESFLKNLKNRTQSRRIVCILDTTLQAKPGVQNNSAEAAKSLSGLVNRTGVTVLCAGELINSCAAPSSVRNPTAANAESPLIHYLCENIKSTQGSATLYAISQYLSHNIEQEKSGSTTVIYPAPDSDFVTAIPLGLPIKNSSIVEQLRFGHPVGTLALDRPDLDQMVNTHNSAGTQDDESEGGSFYQIDIAAYLGRMKKCIQAKWQPPAGFEDRSVATMFTVAKDGTIADASVVASSGNNAVDDSALAALKAASPLEPLPPGSPESVQIRYKFNWRVANNH